MIEKELKKIKKEEKTLNELLVELEKISRRLTNCPLKDFDRKLFGEFLERVYYSRDEIREKISNYYKN